MSDAVQPSAVLPQAAALPAWITPALIAQTRIVWQPYYAEPLSHDDAIELLSSVGALCDVLFEPNPLDNDDADEPPAG